MAVKPSDADMQVHDSPSCDATRSMDKMPADNAVEKTKVGLLWLVAALHCLAVACRLTVDAHKYVVVGARLSQVCRRR